MNSTNYFDIANYQSLVNRIKTLSFSSQPLWGTMNVAQMLHHLNLAIGSGLGFYQLADKSNFMTRSSNKFMILNVLKKFPKNAATAATLKAMGEFDFEKEKLQLLLILKKAFETKTDTDWNAHTYFGKMTRKQWGQLIMIHVNHHLKQFGIKFPNASAAKKILIVVTSISKYATANRATGLWLGELVHFIEPLEKAGIGYDIISPSGGAVPIDPESLKPLVTDKAIKKFYADPNRMALLQNTKRPKDVDWKSYEAIFYAGGHGTMWDFLDNTDLQTISKNLYENGKFVTAVCHGVTGLVNIKLNTGNYLIEEKKLTGFSDAEEIIGGVKKIVPFSLQKKLKAHKAIYKNHIIPLINYVIQDGNLITGRNPFSTKEVAKKLLRNLQ